MALEYSCTSFELIVADPSFGQQFFGLGEEVDLNLNLNFENSSKRLLI